MTWTTDAGRTLAAVVERALAFQDSRQPQYRALETETASQLTPKGFPTYQELRIIADMVKALDEAIGPIDAARETLMTVAGDRMRYGAIATAAQDRRAHLSKAAKRIRAALAAAKGAS